MLILGIESSCDETAAAVMEDDQRLLANVINSQVDIHGRYGGVVPEIASRQHLENIYPVVEEALSQAGVTLDRIDGIAVTQGPGLIGSLLIGVSFAKAISFVRGIPYVGVDHLTGHLFSAFLEEQKPEFPYIALLASGGHSSIYMVHGLLQFTLLGRTRDDAAGEAFDKVSKFLELGYPGGPVISNHARSGNPRAVNFPRAWLDPESLDFSFSGIKTAVVNYVHQLQEKGGKPEVSDVCASFQEAVVEVLAEKGLKAAERHGVKTMVLAGGVGANERLRQYLSEKTRKRGINLFMPSLPFCTDNAAMIALCGYYRFQRGEGQHTLDMDVYSRSLAGLAVPPGGKHIYGPGHQAGL